MKSSMEWQSHNDRLSDAIKAEAEKAKPLQQALKLFLPMLLGMAKAEENQK